MNNKEDIDLLIKKRNMLRNQIIGLKNKGKNALEQAKRYEELTNKLKKMGRNVSINSESLTVSYWKKLGGNKKSSTSKSKTTKQGVYVLTLAWDEPVCSNEADRKELKSRLDDIKEYLDFLGLTKISTDKNSLFDKDEYTIKYEFNGDDNSFNIVKLSSNYIIDMFSKHENMNNINISIYGKKRTF
jgi:hypothetical protein